MPPGPPIAVLLDAVTFYLDEAATLRFVADIAAGARPETVAMAPVSAALASYLGHHDPPVSRT